MYCSYEYFAIRSVFEADGVYLAVFKLFINSLIKYCICLCSNILESNPGLSQIAYITVEQWGSYTVEYRLSIGISQFLDGTRLVLSTSTSTFKLN
jgi:hypothetical protein